MEGLKCLRCGNPLEQDFGIVACTKCGTVMMVDMDGNLQLADSPSPQEPEAPPEFVPEPEPSSEPAAPDEISPAPTDLPEENPPEFAPEPEPSSEPEAPPEIEPPAESWQAEAPAENAPAVEPSDEPPPEESADANWFDQGLDEPATPEPTPASTSNPTADFSDVENFGNSDVDAGALQFELTLSGIDRSELRAEIFDVLSDPRLYLNVKELAEQIVNGTMVIQGLNAARTSLIVTRLQHLNLQIRWRQQVYET